MSGLAFLGWVAIAFVVAFVIVHVRVWVHMECETCGRWFRVRPPEAARLSRDGCPKCNSPETRE